MLKNLLIQFLRRSRRQKFYSLISVFVLAAGMAISFLVLGNIAYETGFDAFHRNRERIFRVEGSYSGKDGESHSARVMGPLPEAIAASIPEVETVAAFREVRLRSVRTPRERSVIRDDYANALYTHHPNVLFVSPAFFRVFSFKSGGASFERRLGEPNTVLISGSAAARYFPGRDALGEWLEFNDTHRCRVIGIMPDMPGNSQLHTDFLASLATLTREPGFNDWSGLGKVFAYALLRRPQDAAAVERKLPSLLQENLPAGETARYRLRLKALRNIYFGTIGSRNYDELNPGGEISMIFSLVLVASFILLQAILTFVNLFTARAADRQREVGVRKTFGARRADLARQFLGESFLVTMFATLVSLVLYQLLKPLAGQLYPRESLVNLYESPEMLAGIAGLFLLVGLLSGLYPAFYLSRFSPASVLKGRDQNLLRGSRLRKGLVVGQFLVASFFLISTMLVRNQVGFMGKVDLGFAPQEILLLDLSSEAQAGKPALLKNELARILPQAQIAQCDGLPGMSESNYLMLFKEERRREEDMLIVRTYSGDLDLPALLKVRLLRGRMPAQGDERRGVLISESLASRLGVSDPLGFKIYGKDGFFEVSGVIADLFSSYYAGAGHSAMLLFDPGKANYLAVKIPGDMRKRYSEIIAREWKKLLPQEKFSGEFFSEIVAAGFSKFEKMKSLFGGLAFFSILIACAGLLGLAAYSVEKRAHELGVRKVLGASSTALTGMMLKEFLSVILFSLLLAVPLVFLFTRGIFSSFAYRPPFSLMPYVLSSGLLVAVVIASVSWQVLRAARANPVESLRYE